MKTFQGVVKTTKETRESAARGSSGLFTRWWSLSTSAKATARVCAVAGSHWN